MKMCRFLLIISLMILFFSCEKEKKDPVDESIKQNASKIYFTFKVNGVARNYTNSSYYTNLEKGIFFTGFDSITSITIDLLDFNGAGKYVIDKANGWSYDPPVNTFDYSVSTSNSSGTFVHGFDIKDSAAIVHIESYENGFIKGTFSAKRLKSTDPSSDLIDITEGSFYIGTKSIKEVQGN